MRKLFFGIILVLAFGLMSCGSDDSKSSAARVASDIQLISFEVVDENLTTAEDGYFLVHDEDVNLLVTISNTNEDDLSRILILDSGLDIYVYVSEKRITTTKVYENNLWIYKLSFTYSLYLNNNNEDCLDLSDVLFLDDESNGLSANLGANINRRLCLDMFNL